jgi:hypothetical protein
MFENLIPSGVRPEDKWARWVLDFYCHWLAHGCQDNHDLKFDDNTKFMVRRNMGKLVLLVSIREWRIWEQRQCWTLGKPWGGVERHPTEWFLEIVQELGEEVR